MRTTTDGPGEPGLTTLFLRAADVRGAPTRAALARRIVDYVIRSHRRWALARVAVELRGLNEAAGRRGGDNRDYSPDEVVTQVLGEFQRRLEDEAFLATTRRESLPAAGGSATRAFLGYLRKALRSRTHNAVVRARKRRLFVSGPTGLPRAPGGPVGDLDRAAAPARRPTLADVLAEFGDVLTAEESALLTAYAEGRTFDEIAAALGRPVSTTYARYTRAVEKLRRHVRGEGAD